MESTNTGAINRVCYPIRIPCHSLRRRLLLLLYFILDVFKASGNLNVNGDQSVRFQRILDPSPVNHPESPLLDFNRRFLSINDAICARQWPKYAVDGSWDFLSLIITFGFIQWFTWTKSLFKDAKQQNDNTSRKILFLEYVIYYISMKEIINRALNSNSIGNIFNFLEWPKIISLG